NLGGRMDRMVWNRTCINLGEAATKIGSAKRCVVTLLISILGLTSIPANAHGCRSDQVKAGCKTVENGDYLICDCPKHETCEEKIMISGQQQAYLLFNRDGRGNCVSEDLGAGTCTVDDSEFDFTYKYSVKSCAAFDVRKKQSHSSD